LNHLAIFEVISRLLSSEGNAPANLVSSQTLQQCFDVASALVAEIDRISGVRKQVDFIRVKLLVGLMELLTMLLPVVSSVDSLMSVWRSFVSHLQNSTELRNSVINGIFAWSQIIVQNGSYSEAVNPVCFPDQISPVLALLNDNETENVIQVINACSCLLSAVTPSESNSVCLTEVCKQIVHCLDNVQNASNSEVLGCVLDFMMTMCEFEW
jgi:hypothetical protein